MGKEINSKMTYLYLIEMTSINGDEKFYKIGVANKGVYVRYFYDKKLKYNIMILVEVLMDTETALRYEDFIKYKYLPYLYQPKVPFGGSKTECFSICPQITTDTKLTDSITHNLQNQSSQIDKILTHFDFYLIKDIPEFFFKKTKVKEEQMFSIRSIKQFTKSYDYIFTIFSRNAIRFGLETETNNKFNIIGNKELNSLLTTKGCIKLINPKREDLLHKHIFLLESFIFPYTGDEIARKYYTESMLNNYFKYYLEKLEKQQTPEKLNVFIFNESHLKNLQKYIPEVEYSEIDFYDVYKI